MKIFRINTNSNATQLTSCDPSKFKPFRKRFDAYPMKEDWIEQEFYNYTPTHKLSDFFYILPNILVFNQKVYNSRLIDFLIGAGEILPIILEDTNERLYILNVTACYNCLNKKETQFNWTRNPIEGEPPFRGHIEKFIFHEERVQEPVPFKIIENPGTHIYCDTGRDIYPPEEEFYSTYINSGFTGLEFEEIWTND